MTGLVRKAILLSVCGLLFAGAAFASVPSATNSTLPAGVKLVGTAAGVADPSGQFSVTVRDLANNLIANSAVVIDVSACTPDIKIQTTQPFGTTFVDCTPASRSVRALTDGSGVATFRIVGSSSTGSFSTFLQGKIYADGVFLGPRTVAAYDLDGAAGVGATDLSILAGDYFAANPAARSDLDFSSNIGANDLSLLASDYFSGGSATSRGTVCTP